jgi:hypothetical protein
MSRSILSLGDLGNVKLCHGLAESRTTLDLVIYLLIENRFREGVTALLRGYGLQALAGAEPENPKAKTAR